MARSPRITVPAFPHHVIQRGNNRQAIFFSDSDYRFFLECLHQAKLKCFCRIYAYVLMTNHFHLLVEPLQIGDLGRFMQSVGRRYVRYVNQVYRRSEDPWYAGLGTSGEEKQKRYREWIESGVEGVNFNKTLEPR